MKTTKKEVQDRVNHVIALLAQGVRPTKILQNDIVASWGIGEQMVWKYIGKAYHYFEEKANLNRDKELGDILEKYDFLYKATVDTSDFRTAAGILDKRAELIGLKKIIVAGDKDAPVRLVWDPTNQGSE